MIWLVLAVAVSVAFWAGWRLQASRLGGRDVDRERGTSSWPPEATDRSDRDDADNMVDVAIAIVEQHPVGVVVAGARGDTRYRNAAARRLLGNHLGVLVDAAIDRHIGRVLTEGTDESETVEFFGPPKTVVHLGAESLPGGGAVAYIDDVTEAHRLDRVRTDFVANISHELKTPIGAMSALAEALEGETDPAMVRRLVPLIVSESERATRTIEDLIELSRIETEADRPIDIVDLADLVTAARDRVAQVASDRRVAITAEVEPGATITGQPSELSSALGNLVENAVKYSDEGGSVEIVASTDGGWVQISVTDHGIGIPAAARERIFERFFRVDRARSRATGGTGLGLSIVRHTARNHGGDVQVESAEGEGSTFTLRLPLAPLNGTARGMSGEIAGGTSDGTSNFTDEPTARPVSSQDVQS